jgi:hypothetical protein
LGRREERKGERGKLCINTTLADNVKNKPEAAKTPEIWETAEDKHTAGSGSQ